MADDLDLTGTGGAKESAAKQRGRPSNETRSRELRSDIKASVQELADWFGEDDRDEPETLAELIRQKADPIADVLVVWAEKNGVVEKVVRRLVGKGGPLSASRAFGPIVRRLFTAVRDRRAELLEDEPEPERGYEEPGAGISAYS